MKPKAKFIGISLVAVGVVLGTTFASQSLMGVAAGQSSSAPSLGTIPGGTAASSPVTTSTIATSSNVAPNTATTLPEVGMPTPLTRPRPPASQVAPPSTPCSSVGQSVEASVTGFGPYIGMGVMQDIVSLRSSVPCYVSGYPALDLMSSTAISIATQDGMTLGSPTASHNVSIGTQFGASFLLQFATTQASPTTCPIVTSMSFNLPGSNVGIPILLDQMIGRQTQWNPCGGVISVTPFEQSDSAGTYA